MTKIKELLDEKRYQDLCADINYQHNTDVFVTPLHLAVGRQKLEIVNILLEMMAEVNNRNKYG